MGSGARHNPRQARAAFSLEAPAGNLRAVNLHVLEALLAQIERLQATHHPTVAVQ